MQAYRKLTETGETFHGVPVPNEALALVDESPEMMAVV